MEFLRIHISVDLFVCTLVFTLISLRSACGLWRFCMTFCFWSTRLDRFVHRLCSCGFLFVCCSLMLFALRADCPFHDVCKSMFVHCLLMILSNCFCLSFRFQRNSILSLQYSVCWQIICLNIQFLDTHYAQSLLRKSNKNLSS